jgi:hypothetical protein
MQGALSPRHGEIFVGGEGGLHLKVLFLNMHDTVTVVVAMRKRKAEECCGLGEAFPGLT